MLKTKKLLLHHKKSLGIGKGTTVGNAVIENNGEGHIIYKVYNQ